MAPIEVFSRYMIPTAEAPDLAHLPTRFKVKVNRYQLAKFLFKEAIGYRGQPHYKEVVTSRPCVYGVFGSPVGGFWPLPRYCVGCLRCTTQHPEAVRIYHNPARQKWGDSFLTPKMVETILHEAATGTVPVKGQGYRGRLGGPGWDGMWTDMSEIVRPTRDGIHGREYISTVIDLGRKATFLDFDEQGRLTSQPPQSLTLPLPLLFDLPPATVDSGLYFTVLAEGARRARTLALFPLTTLLEQKLRGEHLVPLVTPSEQGLLDELGYAPAMVEIEAGEGHRELAAVIRERYPAALLCHRLTFGPGCEERLLDLVKAGAGVVHLVADYHGHGRDGRFILDLIRAAHTTLVSEGLRDTVTLLGSGGMVCAEHVPKAILCGLDGVALNTPLLAAIQARPLGECVDPLTSRYKLPRFKAEWGVQRLCNLLASWRDQLLEIMGAMGLREVRRLRGEMGRAMFQADLEQEAFGGLEGYG